MSEFDETVSEVENKFRKGITALNQWSEQAREVLKKQPGAVLVGAAVLGFLTGLLLRRTETGERH